MTEMMKKRPTLFFFSESGSLSRCAFSNQKKQTVILYHLCCISPMLYLLVRVNFFGACHM